MLQRVIALAVIAFFLFRLYRQKKNKTISTGEFGFWLVFWLLAAVAVVFIGWIDRLAEVIGFSSQGIDILLYLGVVMLFYLVFKLRLKIEKIEREITKIVRSSGLYDKR